MPTGSGKTLVGLLIGEFRRRARGERVVLLCPNKQLCCQVESQAGKYGIKTSLLIGKQKEYDQIAFAKYQQAKTIDSIRAAMEVADRNNRLVYAWNQISEHLEACHIYCSPEVIEIRPVVPPTLSHAPFEGANQRVYMSATLGENGDIERSFGIKDIARLPMPPGWEKRGTGRRLVLFPGLTGSDPDTVFKNVIAESDRCLILVPHGPAATKVKENLPKGWTTIGAEAIESDLTAKSRSG